jgi:aminopeptidase-like protein
MTCLPIAQAMQSTLEELFPLCRSITGEPNRKTLQALAEIAPMTLHEVPSGTSVLDWVVPPEWTIRQAWISDAMGRRLIDFSHHNLHVVSYSTPIDKVMDWNELAPHVHSHPDLPNVIPYRTSYYRRDWGFCVTHAQRETLSRAPSPLHVCIDSTFSEGSLTYGDLLIPGKSSQQILLSAYICHPSMANDSLSGAVLLAYLGRWLEQRPHRKWSYRLVWVPETIGAVTWLARNHEAAKKIDMGLVVTTCGGPGPMSTKQSWDSEHPINRLIETVLKARGKPFKIYPFDIHGSDERQYASPGYRINMASIHKARYYDYNEYHTSADDLSFVNGIQLAEALTVHQDLIERIESREVYRRIQPCGEVMLSRHNLYPQAGGAMRPEVHGRSSLDLLLWLLWYCDGRNALDDIAAKLSVEIETLRLLAEQLVECGVLISA